MQKRKTGPSAGSTTVERGSKLLRITDKDSAARGNYKTTKAKQETDSSLTTATSLSVAERDKGQNCKPTWNCGYAVPKFKTKF